jgi:hypothetical protein
LKTIAIRSRSISTISTAPCNRRTMRSAHRVSQHRHCLGVGVGERGESVRTVINTSTQRVAEGLDVIINYNDGRAGGRRCEHRRFTTKVTIIIIIVIIIIIIVVVGMVGSEGRRHSHGNNHTITSIYCFLRIINHFMGRRGGKAGAGHSRRVMGRSQALGLFLVVPWSVGVLASTWSRRTAAGKRCDKERGSGRGSGHGLKETHTYSLKI